MHGCGNDYVVVDGARHPLEDPGAFARATADRRFGVGSDGLLLVVPSEIAHVRMRMFNVDGSEAEMCGNGLRCLVKFAWERGLVPRHGPVEVETGHGVLRTEVFHDGRHVSEVEVDMGRPVLDPARVPISGVGGAGPAIDVPVRLADRTLAVTAVSMGNPHAVTWVDDVAAYPVEAVGRAVERHASFPRRTNVEFVEVLGPDEVRQRTWERGCGETLACGTGACAVAVAGALTRRTGRSVLVHLSGGDLKVTWREDDHVVKRGPAVEVFEGVWPGGEGGRGRL
jgi:diaminopimelate epimerase